MNEMCSELEIGGGRRGERGVVVAKVGCDVLNGSEDVRENAAGFDRV